jgi:phosphomethylpyrimidine synthase
MAALRTCLSGTKRSVGPVRLGDGCAKLGLLVGLAPGATTLDAELAKLDIAEKYGIATVTDLTTSADDRLLRLALERDIAVGTVPAYSLTGTSARNGRRAATVLMSAIEKQVLLGVDFLSIHASLTTELAGRVPRSGRTIPITSRGGAIVMDLMMREGIDNPFRTIFDDLLALCAQYRVALSFVGSLRPGSVSDSLEKTHLAELTAISALCGRAASAGVQTIVELVNHVPLGDIPHYVSLGRELFPGSALGALGPSPTDIAVGMDDVAGAIGAASAAQAGIDWINVVTAGEHSHLPSLEEAERAVRYFQLALHIARVAAGDTGRDRELSRARSRNDWSAMSQLALFPESARLLYDDHHARDGAACSMCRANCPLVRYEVLAKSKARTGQVTS